MLELNMKLNLVLFLLLGSSLFAGEIDSEKIAEDLRGKFNRLLQEVDQLDSVSRIQVLLGFFGSVKQLSKHEWPYEEHWMQQAASSRGISYEDLPKHGYIIPPRQNQREELLNVIGKADEIKREFTRSKL